MEYNNNIFYTIILDISVSEVYALECYYTHCIAFVFAWGAVSGRQFKDLT
jgi:hypothetical protein